MGHYKKLKAWLTGERRNHMGSRFKPGSRPAIILEMLCVGYSLTGWDVCQLLKTHNADRDLRHVRRCLSNAGISCVIGNRKAKNGRLYKAVWIDARQRDEARKLIVGGK